MTSFFARVVRDEPNFRHIMLRPVASTYAAGGVAILGIVLIVSGLSGSVGMLALLGAALVSSYLPRRSLVLNRETGQLLVIRRGRMTGGLAPAEVECALGDIAAVEVAQQGTDASGGDAATGSAGDPAATRCELLMTDGSRVPIERAFARTPRKHQVMREQIEGFLRQAPAVSTEPSES